MNKKYIGMFLLSLLIVLGACKKLINISSPIGQLTNDKVFVDEKTATAALVGMYAKMSGTGTSTYPTLTAGCSSDELVDFTNLYPDFYACNIKIDDAKVSTIWVTFYNIIYQANIFQEGITASHTLSEKFKKQATAEALFLRSLCYFELVNIFGEVPLVTTSNVNVSAVTPRTPVAVIYQQIISDLKESQNILADDYITEGRVRVNKVAATALLARIYLYIQNWDNAVIEATKVINNPQYVLDKDLAKVFREDSREAIFQLWTQNGITDMASQLLPASGPSVALTTSLINSFEPGDLRKDNWVNSVVYNQETYHYPYKYRLKTANGNAFKEFVMVLRLGEQYLIRAEANINSNKIMEGIKDLNSLRSRARAIPSVLTPSPLPDLSANLTLAEVKNALEQERRIELFCEFGHRWFDLRRTGRIDAVMRKEKPLQWMSTAALYPIPIVEINANPALKQNAGYN